MKKILLLSCLSAGLFLANAQVGINTETPKSTIDIKASTTTGSVAEGILIPRVDRDKAEMMAAIEKSTMIYITNATLTDPSTANKTTEVNAEGFYYFDGSKWVSLLSTPAAKAKFFYSPTIALPTLATDPRIGTAADSNYKYDSTQQKFIVNIYKIMKEQFTTPVKSSPSATTSTPLVDMIKLASEYVYYVTYSDSNVFPPADIDIDNNGILTYKVLENSIVRNGSFMNVVLKEK